MNTHFTVVVAVICSVRRGQTAITFWKTDGTALGFRNLHRWSESKLPIFLRSVAVHTLTQQVRCMRVQRRLLSFCTVYYRADITTSGFMADILNFGTVWFKNFTGCQFHATMLFSIFSWFDFYFRPPYWKNLPGVTPDERLRVASFLLIKLQRMLSNKNQQQRSALNPTLPNGQKCIHRHDANAFDTNTLIYSAIKRIITNKCRP